MFYRSTPSLLSDVKHSTTTSPVWRRGSARRLITPRSLDRNQSPVFSYSCVLQKHSVQPDVKQARVVEPALTRLVRDVKRNIHPISSDRYGLFGIYNSQVYKNLATLSAQQHFTGVAQRRRAGLITPRSGVQITSPVSSYSPAFQKHSVIAKRR